MDSSVSFEKLFGSPSAARYNRTVYGRVEPATAVYSELTSNSLFARVALSDRWLSKPFNAESPRRRSRDKLKFLSRNGSSFPCALVLSEERRDADARRYQRELRGNVLCFIASAEGTFIALYAKAEHEIHIYKLETRSQSDELRVEFALRTRYSLPIGHCVFALYARQSGDFALLFVVSFNYFAIYRFHSNSLSLLFTRLCGDGAHIAASALNGDNGEFLVVDRRFGALDKITVFSSLGEERFAAATAAPTLNAHIRGPQSAVFVNCGNAITHFDALSQSEAKAFDSTDSPFFCAFDFGQSKLLGIVDFAHTIVADLRRPNSSLLVNDHGCGVAPERALKPISDEAHALLGRPARPGALLFSTRRGGRALLFRAPRPLRRADAPNKLAYDVVREANCLLDERNAMLGLEASPGFVRALFSQSLAEPSQRLRGAAALSTALGELLLTFEGAALNAHFFGGNGDALRGAFPENDNSAQRFAFRFDFGRVND